MQAGGAMTQEDCNMSKKDSDSSPPVLYTSHALFENHPGGSLISAYLILFLSAFRAASSFSFSFLLLKIVSHI